VVAHQWGHSMQEQHSLSERCAAMVRELGRGWGLTPTQELSYVHAILAFLPDPCTDPFIQQVIERYHQDNQEVQALRDATHPQHYETWRCWRENATRILRSVGLDSPVDQAVDLDDLVQNALEEINASIMRYKFHSRFSTWTYTIIVRVGQRSLRHRRAAKRAMIQVPLDDAVGLCQLADTATNPETSAQWRELSTLIAAILCKEGGQRWLTIFQLWACTDRRLIDIGQQVGLSASRVSVLLKQIRERLQEHEALQSYHMPEEDSVVVSE